MQALKSDNTVATVPAMRFYRLREIIGDRKKGISGIIPVSRSAWYAGIKDGRYPKPVKLSEKTTAWRSTDIDALIERLNNQMQED